MQQKHYFLEVKILLSQDNPVPVLQTNSIQSLQLNINQTPLCLGISSRCCRPWLPLWTGWVVLWVMNRAQVVHFVQYPCAQESFNFFFGHDWKVGLSHQSFLFGSVLLCWAAVTRASCSALVRLSLTQGASSFTSSASQCNVLPNLSLERL